VTSDEQKSGVRSKTEEGRSKKKPGRKYEKHRTGIFPLSLKRAREVARVDESERGGFILTPDF
jgi:hypothetical protein